MRWYGCSGKSEVSGWFEVGVLGVLRRLSYSEGCAVGYSNWQVCKHCVQSVCGWRSEGEVVGDLMDGEEEVLVSSRADDVGCEEERP